MTTDPRLPSYITSESLQKFITDAFQEDVGDGDHSSEASIPDGTLNRAQLLIKQPCVIAGLTLSEYIFKHADPQLSLEYFLKDGDEAKPGDIAFVVSGEAKSILKAERLVLNCMQRMSGIASYTRRMVGMLQGTKARLLDTRKTTPCFRALEKWAVRIGGGTNHRFGLYDMIMLKDNHIAYAGSVRKALEATSSYLKKTGKNLKVEIEVKLLKEAAEALDTGLADRIMLDNMPPEQIREAVRLIGGRAETEASGGITESNIRAVAETGVDFISVGALTHSAKNIDMSLKAF